MGLTAAEFFAGMGLVRLALSQSGISTVFANDKDPVKERLYRTNFGDGEFLREDICNLSGRDIPSVDLATASSPCTDLSLAGSRRGLDGEQSGTLWEFIRLIREMGRRRPRAILLENVPGFLTVNGGRDFRAILNRLARLGYCCDVILLDAAGFVPQSRRRLFVVGSQGPSHMLRLDSKPPERCRERLRDIVERLPRSSPHWWSEDRMKAFSNSILPLQMQRLADLERSSRLEFRTAYRRTRGGRSVWEIRADEIAGALRTCRGGSSKQALVQAGRGGFRARWLLPVEYARLQGAGGVKLDAVSPTQALFALGDAVCVPAVAWLASTRLLPLLKEN